MDTINLLNDNFEGIINTKNYFPWSEFDPLTLFLEGLHQFCVRITLLNSESLNKPGTRIPSQIKSLMLFEYPDYNEKKIHGNYISLGNFYLVTFTAFSLSCNKIAEGKIYIANI